MTIDENELFKYDPESEFYNDICYPYTTKEKTDIILNDRRKEFLENKLTLCENNCKFNGYNSKLQSVYCKCNIKEDLLLIFNSNKHKEIYYQKIINEDNNAIKNFFEDM